MTVVPRIYTRFLAPKDAHLIGGSCNYNVTSSSEFFLFHGNIFIMG
ncbi:hypothetical protein BH23CHL5_BH23CHL5_05340 [soil metagenome]